jgi:hypothetical protein
MHTLKCKKPLSQHTAAMNLVGRRRRRLHTTPQQLLYFLSLSLLVKTTQYRTFVAACVEIEESLSGFLSMCR